MNKRNYYLAAILIVCGLINANETRAQNTASKPNIILIMVDDIGYEAFGSYGNTNYKTPRLDKMASEGMQFNQCYAQPLCTPSRVKIMTGKYNFRNYERWGYLNTNETTFVHLLKAEGYATCIAGKWQLRGDEYAPYKAGFDEYHLWQLTFTSYNERYKNPRVLENGKMIKYNNGEYGPQLHTDFILDFMEQHKDGPFLAYYPMALTHRPYVPTPDSDDYDEVEIPGSGNAHSTISLPKYFKDEVAYVDRIVGEILDKVHELGIQDNTLIMFTGDNGTGGGINSEIGDTIIPGMKGSTNKYGTHVPLIAYWASQIKSGQVSESMVDFSDFLPTIAEAAGINLPETFVTDGTSFYTQFNGDFSNAKEWNYCYFDPKKSKYEKKVFVQNSHWKLYESGAFYDVKKDPYEKTVIAEGELSTEVKLIKQQFQKVLDDMKAVASIEE
jgi:arylsulfatase A